MSEKTSFGKSVGILGLFYSTIIGLHTLVNISEQRNMKYMNLENRPAHTIAYDVNKDGLEDIIQIDGTISIRQPDKSYILMYKMRDAELDAAEKTIQKRYDEWKRSAEENVKQYNASKKQNNNNR